MQHSVKLQPFSAEAHCEPFAARFGTDRGWASAPSYVGSQSLEPRTSCPEVSDLPVLQNASQVGGEQQSSIRQPRGDVEQVDAKGLRTVDDGASTSHRKGGVEPLPMRTPKLRAAKSHVMAPLGQDLQQRSCVHQQAHHEARALERKRALALDWLMAQMKLPLWPSQ